MDTPTTAPITSTDASTDRVHLTLWVDASLDAALRRVAAENDRTVSAEVRQALREYLKDALA